MPIRKPQIENFEERTLTRDQLIAGIRKLDKRKSEVEALIRNRYSTGMME
jgi:hypothetical protein